MEYLRNVDQSALAAAGDDTRFSQWLLDHDVGQHALQHQLHQDAGRRRIARRACTPTWSTRSFTS